MKQYRVREGNTGILYLTDSEGNEERYIPDYDLDKARELLLEFQELKDENGKYLKDNYWAEGFNWYPTMVSYLYWHVFFRYVKYKPLIDQVIDGDVGFQFENKADLHHLIAVLKGENTAKGLKMMMFRTFIRLNNWLVLRFFSAELLLLRFTMEDFRSVEIRKTLDEFGTSYIEIVPPGRIVEIFNNIIKKKPYYHYGAASSRNSFRRHYKFGNLDSRKKRVFKAATERLEFTISSYLKEYKRHLRNLHGKQIKTLYGFDDSNGYIFPLLYACQQNGIRTVGHQHGAYVKRHASYVMEGIEKGDYRWFDKVIVWGEYWKQYLLNCSRVYNSEMFVVGSNKSSNNYAIANGSDRSNKRILLPYEFATNTFKVGRYVTKLMDLGYKVYFKPRPDEQLEGQLEAYCLTPQHLQKLHIVNKIDGALLKNIDIIAGTMTSLLYELLPSKKIFWVLETEFKHLDDLVEQGYAHKVKYNDLENLGNQYFTKTQIQSNYFFNPEPLSDTLRKYVIQ